MDDRHLLLEQVREWGDLNTDAVLDAPCKIFRDPSIEGFIGYRQTSGYAVVFGDPVCAPTEQLRLAEAFKYECHQKRLKTIYTLNSEEFASKTHCPIKIEVAKKLLFNPSIDPLTLTGSKAVLLRKKVKHAIKDGAEVFEYLGQDPHLEQNMQEIGMHWLKARRGPQIYIAHMNLFSDREGKRWFVAKQGEEIVGFVVLNQLKSCAGWLLNNLIVTDNAPVGTSELLVTTVFKTLQKEKCTHVIVGPVIVKRLENVVGMHNFSSWLVKRLFNSMKKMFRLEGQTQFWEKFQPHEIPSYLLFESLNPRALKAWMTAFNVHMDFR